MLPMILLELDTLTDYLDHPLINYKLITQDKCLICHVYFQETEILIKTLKLKYPWITRNQLSIHLMSNLLQDNQALLNLKLELPTTRERLMQFQTSNLNLLKQMDFLMEITKSHIRALILKECIPLLLQPPNPITSQDLSF